MSDNHSNPTPTDPGPPEPPCLAHPIGRRPHAERVREIDARLPEGKTAAVCIDDTPEHRAWYLHELGKYNRLEVVDQGILSTGIYTIKVRKLPSAN